MPIPIGIFVLILWAILYLFPKLDETYNDGKLIKKLEKELEKVISQSQKRTDDPAKIALACEMHLKKRYPDLYKSHKSRIKKTLQKAVRASAEPKISSTKPKKSLAKKLVA